jgi:hypothetical protein
MVSSQFLELSGMKKRYKEREEEKEDVSSYWMTFRKREILKFERDKTRSHSVANSLWKRLWTYHKTDYVMDE